MLNYRWNLICIFQNETPNIDYELIYGNIKIPKLLKNSITKFSPFWTQYGIEYTYHIYNICIRVFEFENIQRRKNKQIVEQKLNQ